MGGKKNIIPGLIVPKVHGVVPRLAFRGCSYWYEIVGFEWCMAVGFGCTLVGPGCMDVGSGWGDLG